MVDSIRVVKARLCIKEPEEEVRVGPLARELFGVIDLIGREIADVVHCECDIILYSDFVLKEVNGGVEPVL